MTSTPHLTSHPGRPAALLRGLVAALVALLALVLALPDEAAAAPAATAGESEQRFFTLMNQERARVGLPPMANDQALADTSRSWSRHMASTGTIFHDGNLAAVAQSVEPQWRSVGENVGKGSSADQLHAAFMASSGHRANIMSSRFNRVGIGVHQSGSTIYVTVRFLEGPALAATAVAPPPPAGVRTVLTADFDGDRRDDVVVYNPGTEADELWFGDSSRQLRRVAMTANGQYRPVAGDFDGDGRGEILWYAPGTQPDYIAEWNGAGWSSRALTINGSYRPVVGDFDADGFDDVLWYGPGRAADFYWYGAADGSFRDVATTINGTYRVAVGDLDGNRGDDLLWHAPGTAPDYIWYSNRTRGGFVGRNLTVNGSYIPVTGEFTGDGRMDVLWYTGAGPDYLWAATATLGRFTSTPRTVNGSYLTATGDFDGNRLSDILWFTPSSARHDGMWWTASGGGYQAASIGAG